MGLLLRWCIIDVFLNEKRREEKRRFSTLEKHLSQQAVVAVTEETFNDRSRTATKTGQRGDTKAWNLGLYSQCLLTQRPLFLCRTAHSKLDVWLWEATVSSSQAGGSHRLINAAERLQLHSIHNDANSRITGVYESMEKRFWHCVSDINLAERARSRGRLAEAASVEHEWAMSESAAMTKAQILANESCSKQQSWLQTRYYEPSSRLHRPSLGCTWRYAPKLPITLPFSSDIKKKENEINLSRQGCKWGPWSEIPPSLDFDCL